MRNQKMVLVNLFRKYKVLRYIYQFVKMYTSFLFACKTAENCLDKILALVGPID